ncbi:MAG: hypothetical protein B6244_03660 [Candidatus Cloacimonetes bacterium 4572_55]|nr:MAG: hypothetical protein B6244_03660 [Candidatus Cloacimonetes bacterium 4572_55]
MKFDATTFKLTEFKSVQKRSLIIGILGLLVTAVGYFINTDQFFFSYLIAYLFWVSIALGALFFVLLFHLTGTIWGVAIRRILETLIKILPILAVFFIPILFGVHHLYHWSHVADVATDPILSKKVGYLNIPFFAIRTAFYFGIWYLIAQKLYKTSIVMDSGATIDQIQKLRKISAPSMIIFALTTTFASFDWIMSLYPHWYSTIFGLYFFSGGLVGVLGFMIYFGLYLNKRGVMNEIITVEHYHNLATFTFGFIIFWGYMAFSQYLLIWYANIPEETIFYLQRSQGTWSILNKTLVIGHFAIPFVGLLTRNSKRNFTYLKYMALFILAMHWIDLYWVVMPTLHKTGIKFSIFDLTSLIGIGGIFMWLFWTQFGKHAITPYRDPKFMKSVKHEVPYS